jgi:hypothetical protein
LGPFLLYKITAAVKSLRLALFVAALVIIAGGLVFCEDPLAWLNTVRRTAGAPPVAGDTLLSETAARFAARLAARGIITHRGDDGSTGLDRYRAVGGTEVRVGEILGAGPAFGLIEKAWMASRDHRMLALSPDWTHAGWGSAPSGESLVMVMMFTCKLVEGLAISADGSGLQVEGHFVPVQAADGVLLNGLDEVAASAWDPANRAFRFSVPASLLAGYLRLGYRTADGGFTLTNAFTLPRPSSGRWDTR